MGPSFLCPRRAHTHARTLMDAHAHTHTHTLTHTHTHTHQTATTTLSVNSNSCYKLELIQHRTKKTITSAVSRHFSSAMIFHAKRECFVSFSLSSQIFFIYFFYRFLFLLSHGVLSTTDQFDDQLYRCYKCSSITCTGEFRAKGKQILLTTGQASLKAGVS